MKFAPSTEGREEFVILLNVSEIVKLKYPTLKMLLSLLLAGSTAEMTVHVNGQAEGSNVATAAATDGIEMNTAEVIVHVNGQAEGSNVATAAATDGIETNTAVAVGLNRAESPEADNPTVREKSEISLPSSRKLSTRRSRRTRRNVPASNSGTDVEIVVHGCEGDAQEVEPGSSTFTRDKTEEEEEENEVLQLQDRLIKQRCVSVLCMGVAWRFCM